MVDIDTFKLDVEGTDVLGVESDYILSNGFNFRLCFFILLLLFWPGFVDRVKCFRTGGFFKERLFSDFARERGLHFLFEG